MALMSRTSGFSLEVTLDASQIENRTSDQPVQVVVQDSKGMLHASRVTIDAKNHHVATSFSFADHPGSVRVLVGPADATPEEMTGLQTIALDVPARQWANQAALRLPPIIIPPYYWYWWLIWCREFVIHGRVLCADGQPAPGATVCAFDVDWFLWWSSTQQIACTTTDITGAFTLKFRWCCGWWPWWWWRMRHWQLDPVLIERIAPVLQRNPDLKGLLQPKAQPVLADLREFLGAEAAHLGGGEINPAALAALREPVLKRLPPSSELEKLRIWPWYPWYPWFDCTPDVIFKVTQNCNGNVTQIVNETIWDTRWDIPTTLNNVTLIANDLACCVPPPHPCPGGAECLDFTTVCGGTIDDIGGNINAPATPIGYHNPQVNAVYSDQPYAEAITISGTVDCMDDVDYYEFESSPHGANSWSAMPPAANGAFTRTYLQFLPTPTFHPVVFAATSISGHNVYESLQHYQATHPAAWGFDPVWIGARDQLITWLTAGNFTDGTYDLRVRGWTLSGGTLTNERVLKVCGSKNDANLVLRVDNRVVGIDPHGNPCGSGTIHTCTNEPDTAIISIKILKAGGGTVDVEPCGAVVVTAADTVVIDFVAYDPDGHLAEYSLHLEYGLNQSRDLLDTTVVSSALSAGAAWSGVLSAGAQVGPNYSNALTLSQGATRPTWQCGTVRLTAPASGAKGAFPITCCYLLRLQANKRTIVNCNDLYRNYSETSFTITVSP